MKDRKGNVVEGKYVNFANPKEVYVKTKNGTFDIQTEGSTGFGYDVIPPAIRFDTDADFTNVITMIPKHDHLSPNSVRNMIKSVTGEEVDVRLGGWVNKRGELYYRNTGGKLDRLNNYLNTK
jgi:hypothetical protein